jgi:hypothetical protein
MQSRNGKWLEKDLHIPKIGRHLALVEMACHENADATAIGAGELTSDQVDAVAIGHPAIADQNIDRGRICDEHILGFLEASRGRDDLSLATEIAGNLFEKLGLIVND